MAAGAEAAAIGATSVGCEKLPKAEPVEPPILPKPLLNPDVEVLACPKLNPEPKEGAEPAPKSPPGLGWLAVAPKRPPPAVEVAGAPKPPNVLVS